MRPRHITSETGCRRQQFLGRLSGRRRDGYCSYFSTIEAGLTCALSGSLPNSRRARRCRSRSQHWSNSTCRFSRRTCSLLSREQSDVASPEALSDDKQRLEQISVELDRCWDLLRQRRALRDAGQDPDDAEARDASTVEKYLQ